MDEGKKNEKLRTPEVAIKLKIKDLGLDVSSKVIDQKCGCGAPIVCVIDLNDNPDMIYNTSRHICLNPDCTEERVSSSQTCNMGGGASPGNQDIYDCSLCGRKFDK